MRRPVLAACAVAFVASGSLALSPGSLASRANAATVPACKSTGVATSTCVITWTGTTFSPATLSVQAGVGVEWSNQGQSLVSGTLNVTPDKTAPNRFATVKVAQGATSKPVVMANAGTEKVQGSQRYSPLQTNVNNGVIHVVSRPSSPPPASHSPAPKQTQASHPPSSSSSSSSHSQPPAGSSAPPAGLTNPPPLGVGAIPTPAPSPAGPQPQVAGPALGLLEPTPTPSASTDAPHALAQSVPARKYGLPGALAAVLLAGVAVGLVRAARAEIAGPHPQDGSEPNEQ